MLQSGQALCPDYCSRRGAKGCEPSTRDGGLPFQELTVLARQSLPSPLQPIKLKLRLRQVFILYQPLPNHSEILVNILVSQLHF
jgi:hypothetical protein